MTYYYNGTITFDRPLTEDEQDTILFAFGRPEGAEFAAPNGLEFNTAEGNFDDAFEEYLDKALHKVGAKVASGRIAVSGDEFGAWIWQNRWVYANDETAGLYLATDEELEAELRRRHPDYPKTNIKRILGILQDYIENDAESAEIGYILEVLRDQCGLDKAEAEDLGLGWIFDIEDDEEEE